MIGPKSTNQNSQTQASIEPAWLLVADVLAGLGRELKEIEARRQAEQAAAGMIDPLPAPGAILLEDQASQALDINASAPFGEGALERLTQLDGSHVTNTVYPTTRKISNYV